MCGKEKITRNLPPILYRALEKDKVKSRIQERSFSHDKANSALKILHAINLSTRKRSSKVSNLENVVLTG